MPKFLPMQHMLKIRPKKTPPSPPALLSLANCIKLFLNTLYEASVQSFLEQKIKEAYWEVTSTHINLDHL